LTYFPSELSSKIFVEKFNKVSILVTEVSKYVFKVDKYWIAFEAVRGKTEKLGMTEKDVGEGIERVRSKKREISKRDKGKIL
jgi:hypothetical protein